MARKNSIKTSACKFKKKLTEIETFLDTVSSGQTESHRSWLHNYAIIALYREFESLMLACLVGAINNDTTTVSASMGIQFPKHMKDEVCVYLIIGSGYFDFKGRSGLIGMLKEYVLNDHYLVTIVKKDTYRETLEQLSALRNFAAHESVKSKRIALKAINAKRISSSGSWLKINGRMNRIISKLTALANDIATAAPY